MLVHIMGNRLHLSDDWFADNLRYDQRLLLMCFMTQDTWKHEKNKAMITQSYLSRERNGRVEPHLLICETFLHVK